MELDHLLTRSGLMYPEASFKGLPWFLDANMVRLTPQMASGYIHNDSFGNKRVVLNKTIGYIHK
jgi:hypothetical protein